MRIIIIVIGRVRPPFVDDCEHYEKLLRRHARLEVIQLRDEQSLKRRIPTNSYVVLLDEHGAQYESQKFAGWLEDRRQGGRDLCFVIGGAFGLSEIVEANECISLGKMTFAHQLARVILLEQLFRAHKIIAGETYHH